MQKKAKIKQTKKPRGKGKAHVDREAVRVLAIAVGGREAARELGIKESTVLSWAKRYGWKLPKRKGGATIKNANAITMQSKPGDALIAHHKELEQGTKTALMQTLHKAVKALAKKGPLDVSSIAQFKDACLAGAKLFGWDGNPQAEININNQVCAGIVCTEEQRQRLIQLREQIGATATLSANQNDSSELHGAGKTQGDNIGAGNSNLVAAKEVTERPTPAFSAPAGATAPSDASPTYRAWLEHEKAEPEPGPEYEI
jgi:Putative ATPase subunit of terminase (gpP-like)